MENVHWFVLMNMYLFVVLMVKHMTMTVNDKLREFFLNMLTVVRANRNIINIIFFAAYFDLYFVLVILLEVGKRIY